MLEHVQQVYDQWLSGLTLSQEFQATKAIVGKHSHLRAPGTCIWRIMSWLRAATLICGQLLCAPCHFER
jgi:hypothetical protein